ncbi:MAG: GDSL-type esterase/lipase family protein [Anaerolineae bacterium]
MKASHRIIAALVIALLISLAVNFILFTQGQQYYLQLNETRLDPLGLNDYPTTIDSITLTHPENKRVVFFGDSRAASWPAPDLPGLTFINRGIGAETSAQTLGRFAAHVKPLQPHLLILQIGVNDLKTIPLFPERQETIIANCKSNIQQIVNQAVENGATVIVTTIFPTGPVPLERQPFWSANVDQAIEEVNNFIRSLPGPQVIIFDTYPFLTDQDVAKNEYYRDTLHLNEAGYEALNRDLARLLTTLK